MELNYTNTPVCAASEPQVKVPTVVEMTDELRRRIRELRDAATKVTESMIGERIDLPDGGEGPLPARMTWTMDALFRITEELRKAGGFLG